MSPARPTQESTGISEPWRRPHAIPRRTALLSGVALAIGLPIARARPAAASQSATAPRSAPGQAMLPAPTGHLRVGTTSLHLIDPSRPDPWVPAVPYRELMIQIWYPAVAADRFPRAPWMTPVTTTAYQQFYGYPPLNVPVTSGHLGAPARRRAGGWPVVLYSHSLQGDREEATALVEDLASNGYVVVTIDHVHDADVVELPDGRVETSALPGDDIQTTITAIRSRFADVRFVLGQLAALNHGGNPDHEHRPLPLGLPGALNLGAVGMFGHSDGGATTAHAIHLDPRITAGVNLDGTLWTPQAQAGSDRPFLLFGRENLDPFEASTWASFQASQRGPKLQLNLTGSTHLTFTDLAVLVPLEAPILGLTPAQITALVGGINGERAVTVQRAYLNAFFARYLHHDHSSLLTGPSPRYPEVVFAPH
jgi:predicted dienelactone hydrolase